MWPKKLKPATSGNRTKRPEASSLCTRPLRPRQWGWLSLRWVGLWVLLSACGGDPSGRPDPAAGSAVMQVRVAHLTDYAWQDRDGNGQPDNLKPEAERAALVTALLHDEAEVLVLRGLGSAAALEHLAAALTASGGGYAHTMYIPGTTRYAGLGILSRAVPTAAEDLAAQSYRVRNRVFHPKAGGVRISGAEDLWIWNAALPEAEAGYERRRNEARLLAQVLRPLVDEGAAVLLTLHSREELDSPLLRMFVEAGMVRVVPVDAYGDSWTYRDPDGFSYRMDQWVFASPSMAARIEAAQVLDGPEIRKAGSFRHQELRIRVGDEEER